MESDRLTISAMVPSIVGRILLSTSVGMWSSLRVLLFIPSISLCTSVRKSGENFLSTAVVVLVH